MISNLRSSLVVFLVALPLCLGIAYASGAPLSAGVLAGIIGGVLVGLFSGSEISVSGPAAGLTVIVAGAIGAMGSFELFCLSVLLAGLMQIALGLARAGDLGQFFPSPVIKGMLAAIGLILIIKQAPLMVGWHDQQISPGVALVGLLSLAVLLGWEKILQPRMALARLVPPALVVVLVGVGLQLALQGTAWALAGRDLVSLPYDGTWQGFWGTLRAPIWSGLGDVLVWKTAGTLAIVASLETLLSLDAADQMDPLKRVSEKNRELVAQGLGNTLAGFVGALPVTAVIVRTSANVSAGGTHRSSAVAHGLWLLGCAMFIPGILNLIPLAGLAAVLLLVGYKLCRPDVFREIRKQGEISLMLFSTTIVAILLTDLLIGIAIGMALGLSFTFRKYQRDVVKVEHNPRRTTWRFHHHVTFLHKPHLLRLWGEIPEGVELVIEAPLGLEIHHDVEDLLRGFHHKGVQRGIHVRLELSAALDSP